MRILAWVSAIPYRIKRHGDDLISVLKMRLSEYTELNWTVTNRVFITIKGRGICIEWFFIDFEVGNILHRRLIFRHLQETYQGLYD